jgi:ubiquinone/menaquinone biosynthesis C-methylase UbiE
MQDFKPRAYYEVEEALGFRESPEDRPRYKRCLRLLGRGFDSILDAGCGEGFWLDYVWQKRKPQRCAGIEIAENRADKARERFPHLDIRAGDITRLPFPDRSFAAVTCFEVLEHMPDWKPAVEEVLRVARNKVLITVPVSRVSYEICIHCHKPTPKAGHLHSFSPGSFADVAARFPTSFVRLPSTWGGPMHRAYYRLFRVYRWLAVLIRVDGR